MSVTLSQSGTLNGGYSCDEPPQKTFLASFFDDAPSLLLHRCQIIIPSSLPEPVLRLNKLRKQMKILNWGSDSFLTPKTAGAYPESLEVCLNPCFI